MKMMKWGASALALGLVHFAAPAEAAGGKTLETVKARGMLNCTGHD
ncbi:amino acid ABC transporter substrate-binding protein, partial [Mesorhizobium sp. M7A.F.Ca.CA.001.10.2.1]